MLKFRTNAPRKKKPQKQRLGSRKLTQKRRMRLAVLLLGVVATAEHRLFLIGETGAGKSSFGNRLLRNISFAVGDGYESVTKAVSCQRGTFRGRDM